MQPQWPLGVSRAPWRVAGGDEGVPVVSGWDVSGFFLQVMRIIVVCMFRGGHLDLGRERPY